jgi:hypothetical protein
MRWEKNFATEDTEGTQEKPGQKEERDKGIGFVGLGENARLGRPPLQRRKKRTKSKVKKNTRENMGQVLLRWMEPSPVRTTIAGPPPFILPLTRDELNMPSTVTGMPRLMWPS